MIYDMQSLKNIYNDYANINQKIMLEEKKGNIIRIKKGLFTDDIKKDKYVIANICYSPSYISFEYALSFYGLIPEAVSIITSAVLNKNRNKTYRSKELTLEYRHIPSSAFPHEVDILKGENGINYKIASKEKALCDTIYSKYPVRSIKDLKIMLYEDLRIDIEEIKKMDFDIITELALHYKSNSLKTLVKYIRDGLR